MRKVIRIIASTLVALSIFSFAGTSAITAQAAGEYKNAVYEGGIYATSGDKEMAIFFYMSGKNELVYLNDGKNYAYSTYTLTDATVPGYWEGKKLTAGELVLYTFEANGHEYVMTEDGMVYLTQEMTAYEAQQIRDAF